MEKNQTSGKSVGVGTATVDDVTISGYSYSEISDATVEINLSGNRFAGISEEDDVTDWFTNRPSGLEAEVAQVGQSTITITIGGVPTEGSARDLAITIPESALFTKGSNITVDPNPAALYGITAVIKNLTDFQNFAAAVNGGDVKQNAKLESSSITVSANNYVPVGKDKDHSYQGDFDGNNCTLNVNLTGTVSFLALFGINNGTIHDLKVEGSVKLVEGPGSADADYIAVLVAYNDISGKIIRCVTKATLTAYTEGAPNIAHNIGGIAGFNGWDQYNDDSPHAGVTPPKDEPGGTIFQCRNEGDVIGGFNKIGGIAGENAGVIEQCANTGKITDVKGLNDRGWPGVGGITGRNGNNNTATEYGHILNCYNWGEINDNAETGAGKNAYGGITGWCDTVSDVKNCYTTGELKQKGSRASSSEVNPIIGTVDNDPQNTDNNYSLDSIFASSEDTELIGIRKSDPDMKLPAFVNDLNGSGGPYVLGTTIEGYPQLLWEVEASKEKGKK